MQDKVLQRLVRKERVRKRLLDRSDLPRLVVTRSNKHFYAQIIDHTGKVLSSASTNSSNLTNQTNKTNSAKEVGVKLADLAAKAKVTSVVLDRGHYRFHGRVKAFVEGLREKGIKI